MLKSFYIVLVITLLPLVPAHAAWAKTCQVDDSCQISSQTNISGNVLHVGVTQYAPADNMNQDALTIIFPKVSENMGMRFTIDSTVDFTFESFECPSTICVFRVMLPPGDGSNLLKNGSVMRVFASDGAGREEVYDVSLTGFTRAHDVQLERPEEGNYVKSEDFGPAQPDLTSPMIEAMVAAPPIPVAQPDPQPSAAPATSKKAKPAADADVPPATSGQSSLEKLVQLRDVQARIAEDQTELMGLLVEAAGLSNYLATLRRILPEGARQQASSIRTSAIDVSTEIVVPSPGSMRGTAIGGALLDVASLDLLVTGDATLESLVADIFAKVEGARVINDRLTLAENEASAISSELLRIEAEAMRAATP